MIKTNSLLQSMLFTIIFFIFGCEDKIQKWDLLITVSPIEAGIVVVLENGTVSDTLSSSQKFDDGTEINIAAAVPEIGWEFDYWEGDLTGSENPITIIMDGNKSVTAVFTILQYPLSITISGEGEVTEEIVVAKTTDYDHGSNIKLTATPETGWEFDHWEGDLSGSENPIIILMDGDKSVTAVFIQIPYNINLIITGNGTVTKNPDQATYFYNSTVQLTATPETGWEFDHWEGDLTGSTNPINLTIEGTVTVEAIFIQLHTLTTNVDGNGTISLNPNSASYKHNSQVQLTANADQGWTFDHWEGDLSGSDNPTTIVMDGDKSVTAVFIQNQYTLSITTSGNGTVTSNPNQASYLYNQNVVLTATPSEDWLFNNWTGDISSSSNPVTISMTNNLSITANFANIQNGLSSDMYGCVTIGSFIYQVCTNLYNSLPVGVNVNKIEFYNSSNQLVTSSVDPSVLNNNWVSANSSIGVYLSFNIGQSSSSLSGWKVIWHCSYAGNTYYVYGYYGLGKVSGDIITLPLENYSIIEVESY